MDRFPGFSLRRHPARGGVRGRLLLARLPPPFPEKPSRRRDASTPSTQLAMVEEEFDGERDRRQKSEVRRQEGDGGNGKILRQSTFAEATADKAQDDNGGSPNREGVLGGEDDGEHGAGSVREPGTSQARLEGCTDLGA